MLKFLKGEERVPANQSSKREFLISGKGDFMRPTSSSAPRGGGFAGYRSRSSVAPILLFLGLVWMPPLGAQTPQPAAATPIATGPEVGTKIPLFRAPDQNGRMQDFQSLRGPKGAALFFNRSADW